MPYPTIELFASFGGAPGIDYMVFDDLVRGKFDTGKFAEDNVGTDISADFRFLSTSRGRQRALEDFAAGSAQVELDDRSGDYAPNNLSGPYVAGGVTQVRPMAKFWIRATFNSITYDMWSGYADSWTGGFQKPHGAVTTLSGTDGFKVLAAYDPAEGVAAVGAGEDSGARIGRLADNASWPATDRDLDTGDWSCQATTLENAALTEMFGVSGSEIGYLYMSADGKLTYRRRTSRITDARSNTVQATFANNGTGVTSTGDYTEITLAYDDELIKTSVTGTRAGGEPQTLTDSAAAAKYLYRTFNGDNLWLELDTDALEWARWQLELYMDAEQRIESLTFKPARDNALWPIILGAQIGDLYRIVHVPPAGDTITRHVFLEGIDHDVAPKDWTTRFSFSSATVLTGSDWFLFDDATHGKLDTGVMA